VEDRSRSLAIPIALIALLFAGAFVLRAHGRAAQAAGGRTVGQISAQERAATFSFDPSVVPGDRDAFLAAVARARPEAQALIGAVDGLVDVHVVVTEAGTVGTTQQIGSRYSVSVNLGLADRAAGQRGIDRLVLHELGHVVDFALVPPALDTTLDAAIPRGYACEGPGSGSCADADVRERFAESFAKWATGDIGINVNLGYRVPPPDDLAAWGAPLAALVAPAG
jgi:hypothetical protein